MSGLSYTLANQEYICYGFNKKYNLKTTGLFCVPKDS